MTLVLSRYKKITSEEYKFVWINLSLCTSGLRDFIGVLKSKALLAYIKDILILCIIEDKNLTGVKIERVS